MLYYINYELYRNKKRVNIEYIKIIDYAIKNGYIDCAYVTFFNKTYISILFKEKKKVEFKEIYDIYERQYF